MNIYKDFSAHINYALNNFNNNFEPFLKNKDEIINLTNYQKFTAAVFLLETLKSMLICWETGFGKTIFCIYIIKQLFLLYPKWKIFIFVKSSLVIDPWEKTINKYLSPTIINNIFFVKYDLPNQEALFFIRQSSIEKTDRICYIFDESHDFIKKVIPKENEPRRLATLLESLVTYVKKDLNKTIFMTATPINDDYKEFLYMMYLLRPGCININEKIINDDLILTNPELLINICIGLTSFQRRTNINIFDNVEPTEELAGKKIHFVNLIMSKEQTKKYYYITQMENKTKNAGFRIKRRLVNTFSFDITNTYSDKKKINLLNEKKHNLNLILKKINFSKEFLQKIIDESLMIEEKTSLSLNLNLNNVGNVTEFKEEYNNLQHLHSFSSKYIKTCQLILQSKGKCLIYQPFVTFEGVETFVNYLNLFKISFIEYTQKTKKERHELVDLFNKPDNKFGQKIKVCIISIAGVEGISFLDIKDMIIMDFPWSGSKLEQIFGRAIRLFSHTSEEISKRIVNIYILLNYTNNDSADSIDQEMLEIINKKELIKKQLLQVLKNSSIEYIYDKYPKEPPVISENLYPLENIQYKKKNQLIIRKEMTKIFYTFNSFDTYFEGYMDDDFNIYFNNVLIGRVVFEDNKPIIKIIDNNLIYLIKGI